MTKLVVATGFVIAFCAGIMVGLVWHRPGPGTPPGGPGGPVSGPGAGGRASWLAGQLDLSADQQARMKDIWEGVSRRGGRDQGSRRQQVRRDQEEAVARLVSPGERADYDRVLKDARDRLDAIENEGRRAYQQAVEKTKTVLTAEQRHRFDALLAKSADGRPATRPGESAAERPRMPPR